MNWYGIAVLFSAFTFAVNQLALKKVPNAEHPVLTLMLYNLLGIPATLVIAAFQGIEGLSWELVGVALLSNAFYLCIIGFACWPTVKHRRAISRLRNIVACYLLSF